VTYTGVLLNSVLLKRATNGAAELEKAEELDSLLGTYSHRKFRDMLAKPEISMLIKLTISI